MATGDNRVTAEAVARQLGIATVHADVLPADKARIVAELKAQGRRVAMAGDGINDAPALAAADVGIAMGSGADVAIESAGITLLKGDLSGILRARRLAEATLANIKQNLVFAFGYNALGVPIAAGVLYPVIGPAAVADDRRSRHEPVLGVRGRQRAAARARAAGGQKLGTGLLAVAVKRLLLPRPTVARNATSCAQAARD